jgi:hypothetical protein
MQISVCDPLQTVSNWTVVNYSDTITSFFREDVAVNTVEARVQNAISKPIEVVVTNRNIEILIIIHTYM